MKGDILLPDYVGEQRAQPEAFGMKNTGGSSIQHGPSELHLVLKLLYKPSHIAPGLPV